MRAADAKLAFGEWLPDRDDTDNPGLIEAQNVIPVDKGYQGLLGLNSYTGALSGTPVGVYAAVKANSYAPYIYAGTASTIEGLDAGTSWNDRTGSAITTTDFCAFAQYNDQIIWTSYQNFPRAKTVGDATNFATLATTGTAPKANRIGVIGQFVFLGDTTGGSSGSGQNHLQWCGIDDTADWSTPGTAAAISVQAGEQYMPANFGAITAIVGGDQFGLVFQLNGISRVTYVGGEEVFQFEVISRGIGCFCPRSVVTIGGLTYFLARQGVFVTDGVTVKPLGQGKVDKFLMTNIQSTALSHFNERMTGAADIYNRLIYWNYPSLSAGSIPNRLLIYNYEEDRFSHGLHDTEMLFSIPTALISGSTFGVGQFLQGFDGNDEVGNFAGDFVANGVITGPEVELNPGLMTFVQGVKPISATAPTVALGTRNDLASAVTFGSETSVTSATGFADFRSESRYVRPRFTWTTDPGRIQGFEYQAVAAGAR